MKKFIILLGVIAVGLMAALTQGEAKLVQEEYNDGTKGAIQLENPFEKDETVNKLLEHLASVDKTRGKEDESHISVHYQGSIAVIDLDGMEDNVCKEQIQKIERVLKLEGLTDFVYDESTMEKENLLLANIKEEYGSVSHIKDYDQAVVSVNAYKSNSPEDETVIRRARIEMPGKKLKDACYAELAEKLAEEGYYVRELIQGEGKDALVLVNADSLALYGNYSYRENEKGEMELVDLSNMRYEIRVDKATAKIEAAKVILSSKGAMTMSENDKAVLVNAATEMGLNEAEIEKLKELVAGTLEKPNKNQSKEVGAWQYRSKFTTDQNTYKEQRKYLEISLAH